MPNYTFQMRFIDPSAPSFFSASTMQNVRAAALSFNDYYVTHNVPNPKQIRKIVQSASDDAVEIELFSKNSLPTRREGNALRQFSRYLKARTGNFSLTGSYRHKLLKSL